ncbi:MAG: hypothetical protein AUH92_06505 [Acidobacteria bacterium 13_1_40CM_4_69_4]|nr:MAG: hypothetical protein AUH92_06505 [Acidobacteria bacterium 13_1_40CM_4_69_4]
MRIPQKPRRSAAGLAVLVATLSLPSVVRGAPVPGAATPGAITALTLPVSGMTCVLCTRGVEESIKRIDGVFDVSAELATGLVRVQAAEGKSLNIRDVKDRVQAAGFKVGGECEIEAVGRFSIGQQEGRITFRIPGTAYAYQVLEDGELHRLFKSHAGLKGDYFIVFRLHEHPRWKPSAISIVRAEYRGPASQASVR